jgi:hypothetical protein
MNNTRSQNRKEQGEGEGEGKIYEYIIDACS